MLNLSSGGGGHLGFLDNNNNKNSEGHIRNIPTIFEITIHQKTLFT